MKKISLFFLLPAVIAFFLTGCFGSKSSSSESDNSVSGAVSSATSSIAEAADNGNNSASGNVAFNENPAKIEHKTGFSNFLYELIVGKNLYAVPLCFTKVDVSGSWTDASTDIYKELTYTGCSITDSNYTASGKVLLYWSDLLSGSTGISKIQNGTTLKHAPYNKELTNTLTGAVISVEGTGTPISDTGVGGTLANVNVAHTIIFTSTPSTASSYNLIISLIRTKTRNGKTVFEHTITSPSFRRQ